MLLANIMDLAGFAISADAAQFDVDDAACAHFDSRFGMCGIVDALVEANCGANLRLKLGVRVDIVPLQWLFHHQQIELVEFFQVICIF